MSENKSKYKRLVIFSGLVVLFLILRLAVLFSSLDKIYEPEELYRGTITREIIQGPLIPLWEYLDYKVEYFCGGVLTVGIMAVPFFLVFGQTYISLKLVGLLFALGTFILWYLFLERVSNLKTAVICAFLFIFCIPFYTKTSLITWGEHPESNFFTILSVFIFYLIFFETDKKEDNITGLYKNNVWRFFFLGLIAGFSLWFVYTYLITLLFIFLFWFIFDKKFLLRKIFYIFCAGFLLGSSPAVYYRIFYKGEVFSVTGQPIFLGIISSANKFLPKLFSLFALDLPHSFLFERFFNLEANTLSYLYYFIFVFAFIYLLWLNRKSLLILFKNLMYPITLKEVKVMPDNIPARLLILTYPLVFFLSYALSSYSVLPRSLSNYQVFPRAWKDPQVWPYYIGYRYMIPVIPFILVIIGIFIEKIRSKKILFNIFLFLVLGLGLIGNLSLISLRDFGRFFKDKGYSYNIIGDKIGLRVTHKLREYIQPFERLEPDLKLQFYEGLGAGIAWRLRDGTPGQVIAVFEKEINPKYWPSLYRGWGSAYSPRYQEEFERALVIANSIYSEYKPYFYEGFGRDNYFSDMKKAISVINKIERSYRPYCYIGLGYSIGFRFKGDRERQLSLINSIDKEYQKFVYEGLSKGIKER